MFSNGLLCEIGQVLRDHHIAIQTAKILTIGERAEDAFYITNDAGNRLDAEECERLKQDLVDTLNQGGP